MGWGSWTRKQEVSIARDPLGVDLNAGRARAAHGTRPGTSSSSSTTPSLTCRWQSRSRIARPKSAGRRITSAASCPTRSARATCPTSAIRREWKSRPAQLDWRNGHRARHRTLATSLSRPRRDVVCAAGVPQLQSSERVHRHGAKAKIKVRGTARRRWHSPPNGRRILCTASLARSASHPDPPDPLRQRMCLSSMPTSMR